MHHSRCGMFSIFLFVTIAVLQVFTLPYGDFMPHLVESEDADWRYATIYWPLSCGIAAIGFIAPSIALWKNKGQRKTLLLKLGIVLNVVVGLVLIYLYKSSSNYTE